MGRTKEQFTLYSRKNTKGRNIWYYRTYDAFGQRTSGKPTGQTSKAAARNYCIQLFKESLLIPDSSMKLSIYIEEKKFFEWGDCDYCKDNDISQAHATRAMHV